MEVPQIDQPQFRRALARAIIFPLIALLLFVTILLWQLEDMLAASILVDHSDEAIAQAHATQNLLVDMETGLRGYLITGERDFLQPYLRAQPSIEPAIANLAALVADNPEQSALVNQLVPDYTAWQQYASSVIQMRDSGGDYASFVRSRVGKQHMDAIRAQLDRFIDAEMLLRDQRSRTSQRTTQIVIGTSIALALVVGGALAFFSRRQMLVLSRSYGRIVGLMHERARLLEEHRERLKNVIANVPGLVWETWAKPDATNQRIDFVSEYVGTMLGYSADEWVSTPNFWLKIVHPEDQARAAEVADATFQSGAPGVNQFRWIRSDGRAIWTETFSAPIMDASGQPIGMRSVTLDISERKQAERALREGEERFRSLFDSAPLGICLGRDGKILYGNNTFARMFGYADISALQGVPLIDLVAPEARAEIHERVRRRESGEPVPDSYETIGLRPDGSRFPYTVEVTRIMLPDGPASVAFCIDVTARKRDEERQRLLMQTSELLSGSLEYEPTLERLTQVIVPRLADWVAIHMLEDDIVRRLAMRHIDPAKAELARNRPERYPLQPGGQHIVAHVLATGTSEFYADVPDELLVAAARDQEHLKLLRALGFRSYICVPLIARGRTLGAITLATSTSGRVYDTTDLLLAEDLASRAAIAIDNARLYRQAHEAVRARDQFLSIASHELKTPLTSLIGYTDLMLRRASRDDSLSERDQRAIRTISEQAARLNKLVVELLDLSRIETGQLSIDRGVVELNGLVQRLVQEISQTQPHEAERIVLQTAPDPLVLTGDELRLEQVFQNLLQNALKYSPAGGTVAIQIERRAGQACVSVRDEGIGIPAAALPNLFRRFYRAPNVDPQRITGMGVGLFVVKEIVQLHGGEISVESQEDLGSTFTVFLPLWPEGQPAASAQPADEVAS